MTDEEVKRHGAVFAHQWAFWKAQEPSTDGGKMVDWLRWKMRQPRPFPDLMEGMEEYLTPRSVAQADQLRAGQHDAMEEDEMQTKEENRLWQRERRLWRKENDLCTRCGVSRPMLGKAICEQCSSYKSRRNELLTSQRKNERLCIMCGGATENGKLRCIKCSDVSLQCGKNRIARLLAAGLCSRCGRHPLCNDTICKVCYLKRVSRNHFDDSNRWEELEGLFNKQKGRCVYTNRLLELGVNAQLDHIVPRAKGGGNDFDNLQWVLAIVNKAKNDFLELDFLGIVKMVYEHRMGRIEIL